ncbi:MAG: DUF1993 domain-containing protein [Marinomonas sp.]|uniref:DUF1993 domain-containing protein n=1 Tax=Parasphingorhabdus sp. TaxID=2709688 RepID=UPI0032787A08
MALTLYDAFVPTCEQTLAAIHGMMDKAQSFIAEKGLTDADLIEAQLSDDMWPLPWHIRSCWLHSANVLEQLPSGQFSPNFNEIVESWDELRAQVTSAQTILANVNADELEAITDTEVGFVMGGKTLMKFTAQNMLLSFSQPNFHFHATTFYDILRHKGVPLGKRDYLGVSRTL